MARVCMRTGCERPAVARLSYDTVTCQVWLDPVPERPGPAQEICDLHATRLTVPRGWMLCDRRGTAPALFVAEDTPRTPSADPTTVPTTAPTTVPTSASTRASTTAPDQPASDRVRNGHPAKRHGSQNHPSKGPSKGHGARAKGSGRQAKARSGKSRPEQRPEEPELFQEDASQRPSATITPRIARTAPIRPEPSSADREVDGEVERDVARSDTPAAPHEEVPSEQSDGELHRSDAREDLPQLPAEPGADDDLDEDLDELPELLRANSPLLSRAFRATGYQRSVLTQSLPDEGVRGT